MLLKTQELFTFGPFRLDPPERLLRRDGQPVPLPPRAFDLLVVLVSHAGHLVSKEQLLQEVWAGTFVEEANLSYTVSLVRKALTDDTEPYRYIETVPRAGYRFKEPVTAVLVPGVSSGKRSRWRVRVAVTAVVLGLTIIAVIVRNSPRRTFDAPAQMADLRRLTFDPGLQAEPTFSPDGLYVAYTSNKAGSFDIWMQPVASGNAIPVTTDPAHDWQPDWAPKGSQIVFRSERRGGGLFVVSTTGGDPQKVTDFGYRPRWSPDGSCILFSELSLIGASRGRWYTVRPGDNPRPLDVAAIDDIGPSRAAVAWHPDGTRVSFMWVGFRTGVKLATVDIQNGQVIRWNVDEKVPKRIAEANLSSVFQEPLAWAPDGTAVYFVGAVNGVPNIWRFTVDPSALKITGGPTRVTVMSETTSMLALSRDGRRIAFGAADQNARLWSFPLDDSGTTLGTPEPLTLAEVHAFSPDLTQDDAKLLYQVQRPGSGTGLFELRVPGLPNQEWTTLLTDRRSDGDRRFSPHWSPDGKSVAYTHSWFDPTTPKETATSLFSLTIADAQSGDEKRLTTPQKADESLSGWSPDGLSVLSSSQRYKPGHSAIALVPVSEAPQAERKAEVLASSPEYALSNASMSPNRKWLSFIVTTKEGRTTLVVSASKNGVWHKLTDGTYWVGKPRWSRGGRNIYFVSARGGLLNVWTVGFDPVAGVSLGEPTPLTHFTGPDEQLLANLTQLQLAVSSARLIIPVIHPTGGIWTIERFNR